jgi:hypothetical protein
VTETATAIHDPADAACLRDNLANALLTAVLGPGGPARRS